MFLTGYIKNGGLKFSSFEQRQWELLLASNENKTFGLELSFGTFFTNKYVAWDYYCENYLYILYDFFKLKGMEFQSIYHLDDYLRSCFATSSTTFTNGYTAKTVKSFDSMSIEEIEVYMKTLEDFAKEKFQVSIRPFKINSEKVVYDSNEQQSIT